MTVYRCFTEKRKPYAVEAEAIKADLKLTLRSDDVKAVRIINRYDLENISRADYEAVRKGILYEPAVDLFCEEEAPDAEEDEWVLAVEYLPGQFDQRADSCAQCVQLATQGKRPEVRCARLYYIKGSLTKEQKAKIEQTLINPVEARKASLTKPDTIVSAYSEAPLPEEVTGFCAMSENGLAELIRKLGLAMDMADLLCVREYFKNTEKREPSITEIRVIDTYWSDHCRHTTFNTVLERIAIEPDCVKEAYERYLKLRDKVHGKDTAKPVSLWDMATIGAKALKLEGKLDNLDESEEINACSVKVNVDVDGKQEPWLFMFKNETHNHPTEIEPFGGAATCLGGAIRDPLSGRSYVYQAMRITGAGDPLAPVEDTMKGKLPQREIVTTAARGYSSYGNQIGLATGHVHEIYHPGYVAKHMEVGVVLGAAKRENVIRKKPEPGDVVILLGGKTGRDGCGGATGSSKSHTAVSLETCGAEVQKGNPPEERKLQRLFRKPEAARLIRRCNDFGAGGVAVAIGELADGVCVQLDKVPRKYEGLDGTELAISESQERMAAVVARQDAETFIVMAAEENLEAVVVAEVTEDKRLVMYLKDHKIVDLARDFLNTNGAVRCAKALIENPQETRREDRRSFKERLFDLVGDLNIACQKGLVERFDSSIGAASVLMPYGGKRQLTPAQCAVAKFPVLNGETKTCSLLSWGFDPYVSSSFPFLGAQEAVITSVAKVIAAGGRKRNCRMSFQEYFGHTGFDAKKWGLPAGALLGGLEAQMGLGVGSIGGKDSMSGTFEDIDVPPTLIAFTAAVGKVENIISPEFKKAGEDICVLLPELSEEGRIDYQSVNEVFARAEEMIEAGQTDAVWAIDAGGIAEGLFKMSLGNAIGVRLDEKADLSALFAKRPGGFVFALKENADPPEGAVRIGRTVRAYRFISARDDIDMKELEKAWIGKLAPVYPFCFDTGQKRLPKVNYESRLFSHAPYVVTKPRVLIPVFPGTNCEWDSARAFARAGGEPRIFVIHNRTGEDITKAADLFAKEIAKAQIIMIPGGFSGGDEPEGSAKFITAFFRNPKIKKAVSELLDGRQGLMLGICNGFQALIKLGLLPYGRITDPKENDPTLTFNTIGRHQSFLVRTRLASVKSPWFALCEVGDIHTVPVSHGEGRFIAGRDVMNSLIENGQIACQYIDPEGFPTEDVRYNPNGSYMAVEAITSPDGRILGKMGHSERNGEGLYRNIPEVSDEEIIFKGAVAYFR